MFTYFGDNTVKSLFIKYFLSSSYLPTIRLYDRDTYYVNSYLYLKDGDILRCTNSGNKSGAKFERVEPYLEDRFYPNINMKYLSRESTYDSTTHYYLGEYLRYIRDSKGLDLMPYYNCFNNEVFDNIIFYNKKLEISNGVKVDYEITLIPVKYNTPYYVYSHNLSTLETAFCFYNNGNMIEIGNVSEPNDPINKELSLKKYSNISLKNPAIIRTPDFINKDDIKNKGALLREVLSSESNFYLGIKIPRNYNYSLIVLEGDYQLIPEVPGYKETVNYRDVDGTLNVKEIITNKYTISKEDGKETSIINEEKSPYKNLSPLSMLGWPVDNKKIAFSDRLIEYLLLSVISPYDEITDNIKRVQDYMKSEYIPELRGKWDNTLTQLIFSRMKNVSQSPIGKLLFDINGYVDKDTEKVISRGE